MAGPRSDTPLEILREYRLLAPWSIRDLATLAGSILEASGVRPTSAAARTLPNERTIRYYVTRGLVTRPDGNGPAATYSYRHLLNILTIKLRQMEGATLSTIARELAETTGDALERRLAATLGTALPPPDRLSLISSPPTGGRSARVLRSASPAVDPAREAGERPLSRWRRYQVEPGVELHVAEHHPLSQISVAEPRVAEVVHSAVMRLLGRRPAAPEAEANESG